MIHTELMFAHLSHLAIQPAQHGNLALNVSHLAIKLPHMINLALKLAHLSFLAIQPAQHGNLALQLAYLAI